MKGTYLAKKGEAKREWIIVDVKDKVLGRAATVIANRLRGKHRPTFTPHVDNGEFVVVINAAHVKLTGDKWNGKLYHRHSDYMGGLKSTPAGKLKDRHPEDLIYHAVRGMLPKNRLGAKLLTKLKIYPDANQPHEAQKLKEVQL